MDKLIKEVLSIVFLLSLSLCGILGNIFSIVIFKTLLHKKFHWYKKNQLKNISIKKINSQSSPLKKVFAVPSHS